MKEAVNWLLRIWMRISIGGILVIGWVLLEEGGWSSKAGKLALVIAVPFISLLGARNVLLRSKGKK